MSRPGNKTAQSRRGLVPQQRIMRTQQTIHMKNLLMELWGDMT